MRSHEPWITKRGNPTDGRQDLDTFFHDAYAELKRIAHSRLRSSSITLLDTTSLLHEAYLRVIAAAPNHLEDRLHSIGYVASAMRAVYVDFVRSNSRACRGGASIHVALEDDLPSPMPGPCEFEIMTVDRALRALAQSEPRLVEVVEMKYFGGFTDAEIGGAMGLDPRTVRRHWTKARKLLRAALGS